jgi:adenylate cyclase
MVRAIHMSKLFNSITAKLFGDARLFLLEHRLFNTITLLSAISNTGGAFVLLSQQNHLSLVLLNFITGIAFLAFYLLSRFRNTYNALYWPFISLIVVFLFVNSLQNAGSHGGAHYYFISALVMAIVLSGKTRRSVLAVGLFSGAALALLLVEHNYPSIITQYTNERERFFDVSGNLVFAQIFTAAIVQVLAQNLNQERRKSDQLLRNVLPESIALELKRTEKVQPADYESATVLFTDFVGFTQIAESFTPQQVIAELDNCFSKFDEIAKRHRLEKIKTIGDSYMAVGGVPASNHTHAIDCVLAGSQDRAISYRTTRQSDCRQPTLLADPSWNSFRRTCGWCCGSEKFSYDVWGDTVNTASRCESSGVAGRVNISSTTYELVKELFDCEYRGKVTAKNKGELDMYFVDRIRDEFSVDAEGSEPNRRFYEALEGRFLM